MRIISGAYKGRRLKSPPKNAKVRPSTDRVRETLFNLLFNMVDLNDTDVLDLFCGTGSLGIECLSRGAAKAVFVDTDIRTVNENLSLVGAENSSEIVRSDVTRFLKRTVGTFDVIFADPPYSYSHYDELIDECFAKCNLMVLEHSSDITFDRDYIKLRKDFGETALTFFEFDN
jgi:16S rRNA (guanine(966)-N(2))-methyltransferase RsmD